MVMLMQFGQEVIFTSGGPRIAVGKQERGKKYGKNTPFTQHQFNLQHLTSTAKSPFPTGPDFKGKGVERKSRNETEALLQLHRNVNFVSTSD